MNLVRMPDGVRLYCEDFGEGTPILFVCGGNLTHKGWESQVAALAGEFRTITFDWRGTGASDKPRGGYTLDAAVSDVVDLAAALKLGPALLVGHGLGAHLALLAVEKRPEIARGLLLTGAAPWFSGKHDGVAGGVPEEFLRMLVSPRATSLTYADACFEMADKWLFHRKQGFGTMHAAMAQALEWPKYVLDSYAASMRGLDHRKRAAAIRCPAVVVQGRNDKKQRYEGGVELARLIPGARLVTFEHSATMCNVEEVERFNDLLAEFARSLPRERRAA